MGILSDVVFTTYNTSAKVKVHRSGLGPCTSEVTNNPQPFTLNLANAKSLNPKALDPKALRPKLKLQPLKPLSP